MRETGLQDGVRLALLLAGLQCLLVMLGLVRQQRARRQGVRVPRRRGKASVAAFVLVQAALGILFWTQYGAGQFTAESVGVSTRVDPAAAFAVGVFEYFLFSWAMGALFATFGVPAAYRRACIEANGRFTPARGLPWVVMLGATTLANPITEELLFRGQLVHQFVVIGGPLWLALGLGALVNAANHAYQGKLLAVFHLAFYACVVTLLYSPLGLLGAIGFHFAGDALPLFGQKAQLRAYREERRKGRARKAVTVKATA